MFLLPHLLPNKLKAQPMDTTGPPPPQQQAPPPKQLVCAQPQQACVQHRRPAHRLSLLLAHQALWNRANLRDHHQWWLAQLFQKKSRECLCPRSQVAENIYQRQANMCHAICGITLAKNETFQVHSLGSWCTRQVRRVRVCTTMWQCASSQRRLSQTCDKSSLLTT